jgi:hypothetical protein
MSLNREIQIILYSNNESKVPEYFTCIGEYFKDNKQEGYIYKISESKIEDLFSFYEKELIDIHPDYKRELFFEFKDKEKLYEFLNKEELRPFIRFKKIYEKAVLAEYPIIYNRKVIINDKEYIGYEVPRTPKKRPNYEPPMAPKKYRIRK